MNQTQTPPPHHLSDTIRQIPIAVDIIIFIIASFLTIYLVSVLVPTKLTFTYQAQDCVADLTLFPDVKRQQSDTAFTLNYARSIAIGEWKIASFQTCFSAESPVDGDSLALTTTIADNPFTRRQYIITMTDPPEVKTDTFFGSVVSTARNTLLPLSRPDAISRYSIVIADKTSPCQLATIQRNAYLSCDLEVLDLEHEKQYEATLKRQFGSELTTVASGTITTLAALHITEATIQDQGILYERPKELQFHFDDDLETGDVEVQVNGKSVNTNTLIDGSQLVVILPQELPREATVQLTFHDLVSTSGRSLRQDTLSFSTSGGPTVTSVSVGAVNVSPSGHIIITFDQPVLDPTAVTRLSGVNGSIHQQSETELIISLQNAPLCTSFTIEIDTGLTGLRNQLPMKEAWRFTSQITCMSSWTIGTSVRGRPITAYATGNGSSVLLFTGGIHGSEPSSTSTMQAWVEYLRSNPSKVPADKKVVIVPNVNPDGIAAGSRNNANNVNLARNFGAANWQSAIETSSGVLPQGGGSAPESEPEAKALGDLTRQLRPRLSIAFHAQGRLVGANKFADSVAIGTQYASTVGYGTMFYNAEQVMGYTITGEYEDWMGEALGTPAILIELPTASGNYLSSQLPALLRLFSL